MGLIERLLSLLFGAGLPSIRETAEVFRENAEGASRRSSALREAALRQFGAEFESGRGRFDRLMDGVNRLPRPALALGTLGLFISAMVDPLWFAARMQGIALVPEPLWWLLGVVVSFYFGARHQAKGQAFRRSMALALAQVPDVVRSIEELEDDRDRDSNPALDAWRATRR